MTEQTRLELLKIAATLVTATFKDGDDLESVFKTCYEIAAKQFEDTRIKSGVQFAKVTGT